MVRQTIHLLHLLLHHRLVSTGYEPGAVSWNRLLQSVFVTLSLVPRFQWIEPTSLSLC